MREAAVIRAVCRWQWVSVWMASPQPCRCITASTGRTSAWWPRPCLQTHNLLRNASVLTGATAILRLRWWMLWRASLLKSKRCVLSLCACIHSVFPCSHTILHPSIYQCMLVCLFEWKVDPTTVVMSFILLWCMYSFFSWTNNLVKMWPLSCICFGFS